MVKVSLIPPPRRRPRSKTAAPPRRHAAAPSGRAATRSALLAAAAFAAICVPADAQKRQGPSIYASKLLWATVNVCDTESHPDTVGIRGSMPGSGRAGETMFMRFQLQYYDQREEAWRNLATQADTGFVPVGRATFKQRQAGRNFVVPPPATGAFILRGAVTFEWRDEDGEIVRRARKRTTSKRGTTAGSDPAGYSAAQCSVRA